MRAATADIKAAYAGHVQARKVAVPKQGLALRLPVPAGARALWIPAGTGARVIASLRGAAPAGLACKAGSTYPCRSVRRTGWNFSAPAIECMAHAIPDPSAIRTGHPGSLFGNAPRELESFSDANTSTA